MSTHRVVTDDSPKTTKPTREELIVELRRFVEYYHAKGAHMLGNGVAFQHFVAAQALLRREREAGQ